MGGTDWRELALVHDAENNAWDATCNTEEQAATDHMPDEFLRQGENEGVFHCHGYTNCGMKRISRYGTKRSELKRLWWCFVVPGTEEALQARNPQSHNLSSNSLPVWCKRFG